MFSEEMPELALEVLKLAKGGSCGLHAIAGILSQRRPDLRPTADPLPVARACRHLTGSDVHHDAIVVHQTAPRVDSVEVWQIALPLVGET